MNPRADYAQLSPAFFKKYLDFSTSMKDGRIDEILRELVYLRASQLNGCAFCVDMHVKKLKIAGERDLRVHHVAIWHESPLFSARERAAFAWTEALTRLSGKGIADDLYEEVRAEFNDLELADLTFAIIAINGWNRASVAYQTVPGSRDAAYGLTAAGLG